MRFAIQRLLLLCLIACPGVLVAQSVNVYSARHYDTDLQLYENFRKQTGIKVNLIEASSDALIQRIVNEGQYSPADVLITVDAGRLYRAEEAGVFSATESAVLNARVPEHFRHPDGLWYGLSKRARVIIYNKAAGKPDTLTRYQDLAKPEFKGQVCVRSSSNIYNISLLAGLIAHDGNEAAKAWAEGVVSNLKRRPQGNDTSNIRDVALGECRFSIVNTYYLARMIADGSDIGEKVGVIFPNQEDTGTHVNISGAGVLKYAPNRENAIKFIEFLTEPDAQYLFVEGNHEYPVVEGAKLTEAVKSLGEFREDDLDASVLGENQAAAVRIFDAAGWH